MMTQLLWEVAARVEFLGLIVNEFVPLRWVLFVALFTPLCVALYLALKRTN